MQPRGTTIAGCEEPLLRIYGGRYGVAVDHGGLLERVAESLLAAEDVHSAAQHIGGKRVPQQVWPSVLAEAGALGQSPDRAARGLLPIWIALWERHERPFCGASDVLAPMDVSSASPPNGGAMAALRRGGMQLAISSGFRFSSVLVGAKPLAAIRFTRADCWRRGFRRQHRDRLSLLLPRRHSRFFALPVFCTPGSLPAQGRSLRSRERKTR